MCITHKCLPLHETLSLRQELAPNIHDATCNCHIPLTAMEPQRLTLLINTPWFWVTSHRQDRFVPPGAVGEWNVVFQRRKKKKKKPASQRRAMLHQPPPSSPPLPPKKQQLWATLSSSIGFIVFSQRSISSKIFPLSNCLNLLSKPFASQ